MGRKGEILLYGGFYSEQFLDEDITARSIVEQLKELDLGPDDELLIRINSPGGVVTQGLAAYNALRAYPAKKIARVEGLAASAASFVMLAADEVEVAEASLVMIHRAHHMTMGDANEHRKGADELEKNDGVIAGIYAKRSGKDAAHWLELMSETTWLTGPEAVEAGLAHRLSGEDIDIVDAAAKHDARVLSFFRNAPAAIAQAQTRARQRTLDRIPQGLTREDVDAQIAAAARERVPAASIDSNISVATVPANIEARIQTLEALAGLRKE